MGCDNDIDLARAWSFQKAPKLCFSDQQTRKALPAWIREGLEKAEQERQKKQTKEAKLRAAEEAVKARRAAKGLGKFVCL